MKVIKRSGREVEMRFDNITSRIDVLTEGLSSELEPSKVAQQVFSSLYDRITTQEIDDLSSETCIGMITSHPDYEILAARIVASNIHKICPNNFHLAMRKLSKAKIITDEVLQVAAKVKENIKHDRDYDFSYFGLKTLEKSYLQRIDSKLVETPQYMFMRVSIGIHGDNVEKVLETYDYMSRGMFIHATPTLFNSGTPRPQLSSCFLVANKEDSIDGIYDTVKECAQISKWAGGIGLHCSDIRANKSHIRGTNGTSDGIIPMLRVYNATARYVNQAGRRKGSIAVYLEPWHADVFSFLELRLNTGEEEARCRDLFLALWIPDLFMKRVEEGGNWSLFCPDKARGLPDVYGEEFEKLYEKYESEGLATKTVRAEDIWRAILKSQAETGTPYMLYKDACNKKSNQSNLGTIKSSNLCTEIIEHTSPDETAVCNLASVALPKFVKGGEFDYVELHKTIKVMTKNLNNVIDRNFYPVKSAERSNMRHRPIGLGVQGLADVFCTLRLPFDSEEAKKINSYIFETIYHASLESSCELSDEQEPYSSFSGSPISNGILQFDMWETEAEIPHSGMYDWEAMRERVKKGVRNSLLVAPMPTASTAQILGNNECFEPYTTNIYLRRTLAGEFVVVNQHLVTDLKKLGLWSKKMKDLMVKSGGSIQSITDIPDDIKKLYRTVWEIKMKDVIDMAAQRGRYIDQSQSMNLFMESPTLSKISSMHMYAHKKGLKTGMYYLRSQAKARPIQVSLEPDCVACSA